jgi:uncharacterized protein (DUF2062 family)
LLDKEKWKKRFKTILSLDSHPGHIAAGFAVGVFISFTPPIPFLHTALAIAAAFVLRLNKVTCITGAWVNTPLTVVPTMLLSYKVGDLFIGESPEELALNDLSFDWESVRDLLDTHGTPILLGSAILGFAAALVSYFLCYYLVVRFRRKDEALAEITEEMEEVGEELED